MAFGPDKRVLPGKKIDLTFEDEEGEEQFHQKVKTSAFGIASAEEVDRASLEAAGVGSYEVQPDKVVFYIWPAAGGSNFSFDFRMR